MITCSRLRDKRAVITYFYDSEDDDFFKKIHKKGGTRKECIDDTCDSMEDDSFLYGVFCGDELAGFFSKYINREGQALNGFHVFKEFRNRSFLTEFWNTVKSKFEQDIVCAICIKNKPAIGGLHQAGFEYLKSMDFEGNSFIILKFKK
jgi:hypothetical protein